MGMYDTFQPRPALKCRNCHGPLDGWQGKDGPCLLLDWTQGVPAPTGEGGDFPPIALAERTKLRLPRRFAIYTNCAGCQHNTIYVTGFCVDSAWKFCVFGLHLDANAIPAAPVDGRWRQCSRCTEAWEDDPGVDLSGCPSCGALTTLTATPAP